MNKTSGGSIDFVLPLRGGGRVTVNIEGQVSEEDGTFVRGLIYGAVGHLTATPRQVEAPAPEPVKKPRTAYNKGMKMEKVPCDYCGGKYARGTGMAAHRRACDPYINLIRSNEAHTNGINTVWQNA